MKPNPNPESLAEMLRVDHAGEYGANRIYEGQLLVLGKADVAPTLKHMLAQEQEHLQKFNELLNQNKVRPSLLMPIWHVVGIALGAGSALLGKKAAMACTVAIEEVIEEHYNSQLPHIEDAQLKKTVEKFRDEEVDHRNTAINNKAEDMAGYEIFTKFIKLGARVSIFLAKKICLVAIFGLGIANASPIDEGMGALKAGNYTAAYNIIQPLAARGVPDAQFALCGMYYNAQGVPKNDYEAARWCNAAAQNNHIDAMFNLALMYQNGEGVGQNFIEAKKWYKEAADRGNQNAQFNLAELNGNNNQVAAQIATKENIAAAAPQQQLAAAIPQQQIAPIAAPKPMQVASIAPQQVMAMQNLQPASGNFYAQQIGVRTIPDEAPALTITENNEIIDPVSACILAAQRGEVYDICSNVKTTAPATITTPAAAATMASAVPAATKTAAHTKQHSFTLPKTFNLDTEGNFSTSLEKAKKGDAEAQKNLGVLYKNGNGIAKNISEAIRWLEKSASKGNAQAMLNLADIYKTGNGVLPNPELAYSWYNLAADRSHDASDRSLALTNVAELSHSLSNQQIGNALQYVTMLDEKIPQI